MTDNSFVNTVKATVERSRIVFQQKFQHLLYELSCDAKGGLFWWMQTHQQKLALDKTLEELLQDARKPDFQLDWVAKKLLKFKLKKDDAGQAQWYQDAHDQLIICQQQLDKASILKVEMIKPALTELRFISEADKFHSYFQLQPLQRRVRDMYESIIERLDILLEETKNKKHENKTELDVREQEAKTQLAVELTLQHQLQLQKEEAELKKVETERELLDQQRDAEEEAWKREQEERKLRLEETQEKHRMELQDSFEDMQLQTDTEQAHKDPVSTGDSIEVSAEEHLQALIKKIKANDLNREDPKVKEQLQALLQAIAGL